MHQIVKSTYYPPPKLQRDNVGWFNYCNTRKDWFIEGLTEKILKNQYPRNKEEGWYVWLEKHPDPSCVTGYNNRTYNDVPLKKYNTDNIGHLLTLAMDNLVSNCGDFTSVLETTFRELQQEKGWTDLLVVGYLMELHHHSIKGHVSDRKQNTVNLTVTIERFIDPNANITSFRYENMINERVNQINNMPRIPEERDEDLLRHK